MTRETNPAIIGTPGGGLVGAAWAANEGVAAAGRRGEIATARLLDRHARSGGPVVMHDLRIPIPRITANIDHVVVAGNRVLLIDSKSWKPGRYWTVGGRTYRGFRRFRVRAGDGSPAYPAEKKTMVMAAEAISSFLSENCRAGFRLPTPIVVVHPTGKGRAVRTGLLTMPGSRSMSAAAFGRRSGRLIGRDAADPRIVAALSRLVNGMAPQSRAPHADAQPAAAPAPLPPVLVPGGDPYRSDSYLQPAGRQQPPAQPADRPQQPAHAQAQSLPAQSLPAQSLPAQGLPAVPPPGRPWDSDNFGA